MRTLWIALGLTGCFFKPSPSGETRDADERGPDSQIIHADGGTVTCVFSTAEKTLVMAASWENPGLTSDNMTMFYTDTAVSGMHYLTRASRTDPFDNPIQMGALALMQPDEEFVGYDSQVGMLYTYSTTIHTIREYSLASVDANPSYQKDGPVGIYDPAGCDDGSSFIDLDDQGQLELIEGVSGNHDPLYKPDTGHTVTSPSIGNNDHMIVFGDVASAGRAIYHLDLDQMHAVTGPTRFGFSDGTTLDTYPVVSSDGAEVFFIRDGRLYRAQCQ
ncbi:MAG: hypothetical protein QM831_37270 [Kofleriaceae bacterium]